MGTSDSADQCLDSDHRLAEQKRAGQFLHERSELNSSSQFL